MSLTAEDVIKIIAALKDAGIVQLDPKPAIPIEEVYKDSHALDNLTDEEVLYWATPHFDYLQEMKESKKERIKEEEDLRNG